MHFYLAPETIFHLAMAAVTAGLYLVWLNLDRRLHPWRHRDEPPLSEMGLDGWPLHITAVLMVGGVWFVSLPVLVWLLVKDRRRLERREREEREGVDQT